MKITIFLVMLACFAMFTNEVNAIGLEGMGGKIGIVMPEGDADTNIGLGFIADLGVIVPELNALRGEFSAEYWGDSYDIGYWEWSWSSISFNGTAKYHFPLGGDISPFAGAGLCIALSRWSSEWKGTIQNQPYGSKASDNDINFGVHLVGGVDVPLSPNMKLTGEAKFSTAGSDIFQITGGLVFKLK